MTRPSHRYVAFMRALNVGGRIVKMDRLRALFEELGFANVATYIASGNVIFESPETDTGKLETTINIHLEKALGYTVGTYVRTPAELAAIAAHRPFPAKELDAPGHTLYVNFLPRAVGGDAVERLMALRTEGDDFAVLGREMYWLARGKLSDSSITGPRLQKALGVPMTNRNLNTVRKLAEKYAG
ncbi:MAG TPA: DUF1697 domain-containing protein [Longimicrobium sp.]|nr:DUF1697 domain-containing protein [Longimicrobium sp.]